MPVVLRRLGVALAALVLSSGLALAQSKVTLAVGGGSCLCYLPTMLAHALGEYEKAGVNVEIVDFKGGSESLKAVIGGSADVVSGYFDHCVNLAAKGQHLQAFVVYDRYPGFALVVSPKHSSRDQFGQGPRQQESRRQRPGLLHRLLPEIHPEEEQRRPELGRPSSASASAQRPSPRWSRAPSMPPSCSIRRSPSCRARTRTSRS